MLSGSGESVNSRGRARAPVDDRFRVKVSLNARVVQLIAEVEDGTRALGWHNIEELAEYAAHLGETLP